MLEALLVIAIGLIPPLLSVWIVRRLQAQAIAKLRQIRHVSVTTHSQSSSPPPPERYYLEGIGYFIGDISCRYNARSSQLRCAVNPQGPCENCRHYEPT